jgi:ATP-binding cassette subfamily F protein 3
VRVQEPFNDVRRPVIHPPKAARGGELVLDTHDLEAGYGERTLFSQLDLRIGRGQRIGIVGPNGSGKSTLLKILAGRLQPRKGEIDRGHKSVCGYYDQDAADLPKTSTPYMEIRREHPAKTDLEIRSHLARFLFRGNEIDKSVSALSGGERARVALAKLVLTEPSWLALDEPTNHLDLPGRTALEEMLGEFPGALLFVSHDREFIDALATRIVEVKDGSARSFDGNYSAYRRLLAEEVDAARTARDDEKDRKAAAERARAAKAVAPSKGASKGTGKSKDKARNPWLLRQVEDAIMALEAERTQLLAALGEDRVYKAASAVRDTQLRLAEIERDLEDKNAQWEAMI